MTTEWPARVSSKGDKILCGRPTGPRGWCDGLIADVQHNRAGRTWLSLPRGEVPNPRTGIVEMSARAAERTAAGRKLTARTSWEPGAPVLPIMAFEAVPPFRKPCPSCGVLVVVDTDVLESEVTPPASE